MARRGRKRRITLEAEYRALLSAGIGTAEVCRQLGIGRKTGFRWRPENGGMEGCHPSWCRGAALRAVPVAL